MYACREYLEFLANTLVFLLAGLIIAGKIYESSTASGAVIDGRDWGYVALLWVYVTVRPSPRQPPRILRVESISI